MARLRRDKRNTGPQLTIVTGGQDPPVGQGLPAPQDVDVDVDQLRRALAAAGAPPEVLQALTNPGAVHELMGELIEAGLLPTPDESLDALIDRFKPLLKRGCDPFDAELAGVEFLGLLGEIAPDPDEVPDMLAGLVSQAEAHGKPEALAMLRALAAVGPPEVRPAAADAADRLVTAGRKDPAWADGLGAPQVGACFGYVDGLGTQESIALTFSYGRRTHALAVLIDHDLGGGVKDCWPTNRPDKIHAAFQQATQQWGLDFHEYEPVEAHAIVERALSKKPCPVAPDQIEDVRDYLSLLQQRAALLSPTRVATTSPSPRANQAPTPKQRARATTGTSVHRVKITLRGAKTPIWRRLEVPSRITLQKLHDTVQQVFGWHGGHLWVFETPLGDYGQADPELRHRSAATKKLEDVARRAGDRIHYTYDFGDDWEHDILVEEVLTAEAGVAYPRCLTGRRAGPPDDCGGIWAYQELLEILADPSHEEHNDCLERLCLDSADEFDPAAFNLDETNEALSGLAKVLAKG